MKKTATESSVRLIAAAPELLEFIKFLLDNDFFQSNCVCIDDKNCLKCRAINLINKAEGV